MAKKKKTTRNKGVRNMAYTAGAMAGGALLGAVIGRGSLIPGGAALLYGAATGNTLLTVAGAAACVAPGQLSPGEKSGRGGVKAILDNAQASVKKLAASTVQKSGVQVVFPNLLPSMAMSGIDGADYYSSDAEQRFQSAMAQVGGLDDESQFAGYLPEGDMGRVPGDYQAMEVGGAIGGLGDLSGSFENAATEVARGW